MDVEQMEPVGLYKPGDLDDLVALPPMEGLREAVSAADASISDLTSEDPNIRLSAILDMGDLLRWAKAVVLDA